MTTFANQLKSEIARIAKKEARVETQQLKKASAQHRSDIAALKRYIAALEVTVKKLSKSQPKPVLKIEEELTTALAFALVVSLLCAKNMTYRQNKWAS